MSLSVTQLVGFGSGSGQQNKTLYQIIEARSLTTNLKLCIDAADLNSYSGAGQTWLDTSGNGYDFFRGTSSSGEGSDPTFNGVAGGGSASEYWSFDGGDRFTYDTTVETWMSNMHKDNAVFSFICAAYLPSAGSAIFPFDTASGTNLNGIQVTASGNSGVNLTVDCRNASGSARVITSTTELSDSGTWNFLGASIDEAASSAALQVNGTAETGFAASYTSPSTTDANPMVIGVVRGTGVQTSGSRLAFLAVWEGTAIGTTALSDLYSDIAAARSYGF